MSDIIKSEQRYFLSIIDDIESADDAEDVLKKLDVLKELLKAADEFKRQSVRYAKLEALALCRIVEIGEESSIKNYNRRKAAIWLHGINEEERERYINMCDDGLSITQIWKREISDPAKRESAIIEAKAIREKAFSDYKKRGIVHLVDLCEHLQKNMAPDDARDFYQGTRDRLIRSGAVGLDDGEFTYCNPEKTTEGLDRAIEIRVHSICADINKLRRLLELAPYMRNITLNGRTDYQEDIVYAMMCAMGIRCASFSSDQARTSFLADIEANIVDNTQIRNTVAEDIPIEREKYERICEVAKTELEKREMIEEQMQEDSKRCSDIFTSLIQGRSYAR